VAAAVGLAVLRADHDQVRALFGALQDASGAEHRLERVREIAVLLILHTRMEDRFLYAALGRLDNGEAHRWLDEARVAHARVDDLIETLVDMDPRDRAFEPTTAALERTVREHLREEEARILPLAERLLGGAVLDRLDRQMREWRRGLDRAA
jgi:hypothetical protein